MFSKPLTDAEFIATVNQDNNLINAYGVMLVAADCIRRGYLVSRPIFALNAEYQLVVDRNGILDRVQVRIAGKKNLQAAYGNPDNYDILALVDRYSGMVYYTNAKDINRNSTTHSVARAKSLGLDQEY